MYILLRLGVSTKRSPPNSTRPIPSWPNTYLKPPHPPPLPTPPQHVQHPTLPYLNPTYLNQQLTYPIQTDAIRLRPPLRLYPTLSHPPSIPYTILPHPTYPLPTLTLIYPTRPTLPYPTLLLPTPPYPISPTASYLPHPTTLPHQTLPNPYLPTYLPT